MLINSMNTINSYNHLEFNGRKGLNIKRSELAKHLNAGLNNCEIANALGISEKSIAGMLRRNGLVSNKTAKSIADTNKVIELFKQGKSIKDIATEAEVSIPRVRSILKKNNYKKQKSFEYLKKVEDNRLRELSIKYNISGDSFEKYFK